MKRGFCLILILTLLLCGCARQETGAATDSAAPATTVRPASESTELPAATEAPVETETAAATEAPAETETAAATEAPAETEAPSGVSMYDLRKAMLAADPNLPEMQVVSSTDQEAEDLFTYLSDLDYGKVESYFLSYAAEGESYEIAVVALRDAADADALTRSLMEHVNGRVLLYKNYAPEQVARAEAARTVTIGRYVALLMCDDQEAVLSAFRAGVN